MESWNWSQTFLSFQGSRAANLHLVRGLSDSLGEGIHGPGFSGRDSFKFKLRPRQPQLDQHQERGQRLVQLQGSLPRQKPGSYNGNYESHHPNSGCPTFRHIDKPDFKVLVFKWSKDTKFFFNVGPPKESIFLTAFYGLYFSHNIVYRAHFYRFRKFAQ